MYSTYFGTEFWNLEEWILPISKAVRTLLGRHILLVMLFSLFTQAYSQPNPPSKSDFPPLFSFLISYDGPENASGMSHLVVGPAGKNGFIRAENGHFVNNLGPVRLHGTNLTGSANFPDHKDVDKLVERLARFGINCVRLHYMDRSYGNFMLEKEAGIIEEDTLTQRNFSASQVDRLDYLISAFKKRGIYVNINLHVARIWDKRDGFASKRLSGDSGLDNFEPRMIELQKEYARKLLTHVNPYTGLAYTDDPCVAMVEINNENGLLYFYNSARLDSLPDEYSSEFQRQWNDWLQKKYGSTKNLNTAWNFNEKILLKDEQIPKGDFSQLIGGKKNLEHGTIPYIKTTNLVPLRVKQDFYQFIIDTERKYWLGMYNYLKKELNVKSIISGTQPFVSSVYNQAELDYVDNHAYWCHPNPVSDNWRIRNESMVNSLSEIQKLAAQRVLNKPYTISEYNHPFPNQYGAEGQAMLCAYGRLQGWDGVFEYNYNQRLNFEPDHINYFFNVIARTDVLAHFPACAAIFLRGDVQEAKSSVIGVVDYTKYLERLVVSRTIGANIGISDHDLRQTLIHKTAIDLIGTKSMNQTTIEKIPQDQKIFTSDTGELTWNVEQPAAGYFTVNTTNTKLFTGFPEGRLIKLGDVSLAVGKTRLGWATVSLVSRNATGFGESGHPSNILLAATGVSENKDMMIEKLSGKEITLKNWGKGPVYVEGIPAKVTLVSDPKRTRCFALDPGGSRKIEVPVVKGEKGGSTMFIKPEYKTVWYEIEIK